MPTNPKTIAINLAMLVLGLMIINTVIKHVPVAGPLVGKAVAGF